LKLTIAAILLVVAPFMAQRPEIQVQPWNPGILMPQAGYSRNEWRHWIDADGDCQDTRQEVLIRDGKHLEMKDNGCKVKGGLWRDPYTGLLHWTPKDLDIDHIVPLKEAAESGGESWSLARKEYFANDMANLVAVAKGVNRSKGRRAPQAWMPPDPSAWCEYAEAWIRIKDAYGLGYHPTELARLKYTVDNYCDYRVATLFVFEGM
jgi:5-methylcytosine-specific restriction endonuclease McrA